MTTPPPPFNATLPYFGGVGERRALDAGMTFLELTESGSLDLSGLGAWLDQHVVLTGCMPRLSVVLEPPAGSVALRPTTGALARANADLPRILTTARIRVLESLRGLISSPSDDRFLRAAIFLGRVRRQEGHWIARPETTAPLSGIVLALFAVAILSERSFYDRQMCVCDTCGRVSFNASPSMRRACATHAPRPNSGTQRVTRSFALDDGQTPPQVVRSTRPIEAQTPADGKVTTPERRALG